MYLQRSLLIACCFALSVSFASAQRGGPPGRGATTAPVDITASRSFDMTQVDRGGKTYAAQCASCHGEHGRGGKSAKVDVDLMRSDLVLLDHGGRELNEFLKFGRPDKGMPKFEFAQAEGVDLAIFLHHEVSLGALWQQYTRLNVFSGDAKAGEAYFNGPVGKCSTCHSVTGDLKGIGAKNNHDAPTLQGAILGGGGRGGRGGGFVGGGRGAPGAIAGAAPITNITATVTLKNGEKFTGSPGLINDFVVQIRLPNGDDKSWVKDGEWPKVVTTNRLQAHIDLMLKYTDADIHNLAAYLNDK